MTEWLNLLLENSSIPYVTALLLGLLTAISPCPLYTNITAVVYISKDVGNKRNTYIKGLLYTLGRILAYSILGFILIFIIRRGEDAFGIQQAISEWGEKIIGPMLIIVGLFMILGHLITLPKFGFSGNTEYSKVKGFWGALILGMLFAMAFCPTSGLFYFGMLIPMSVDSTGGYLLPIIFAIATSLPVLIVSGIIAFSMDSLGKFIGGIKKFQKWFNYAIASLFIGVGIYYTTMIYL